LLESAEESIGANSGARQQELRLELLLLADKFPIAATLFPRLAAGLCIISFLADQQKKRSGSYQKGKQNTDDDRNNPMPTIRRLDPFRPSAFLRRSDAQPEKKVAHRPIPRRLF
jgi:hypothetical protein